MKTSYRFIIVLLFTALAFNGCEKDLLDINPYGAIGSQALWTSESLDYLGVLGV